MATFQLPYATPSWFTGRLWLMRLGYYKLTRPKRPADDWVWIADHSVQLGTEKCLVILGVRLSTLANPRRPLSHQDVEPLTLLPVTHSDGEVVYQQLEQTADKTGIPRQIISDHGPDLLAGVTRFRQAHPATCDIYDIKHKTACVLKHALQHDERWQTFTHLATQTKLKVQQTALACLAPPQQRSKARYMNVDVLIRWGSQSLRVLDQPQRGHELELAVDLVDEKLGWIRDFRWQLQEWGELMQVIEGTEHLVRTQGLYRGVHRELKTLLAPVARLPRAKQVSRDLIAFVAAESFKARPDERLVGSSEVIESVLGKLKRLEQDQAKSGFTGLVLSLAAMVATTTREVIQNALETVPTKRVLEWCKETLGPSVQSKRRKAFASREKPEQKRDPFRKAG